MKKTGQLIFLSKKGEDVVQAAGVSYIYYLEILSDRSCTFNIDGEIIEAFPNKTLYIRTPVKSVVILTEGANLNIIYETGDSTSFEDRALKQFIGNGSLQTQNQTIVGAINEIYSNPNLPPINGGPITIPENSFTFPNQNTLLKINDSSLDKWNGYEGIISNNSKAINSFEDTFSRHLLEENDSHLEIQDSVNAVIRNIEKQNEDILSLSAAIDAKVGQDQIIRLDSDISTKANISDFTELNKKIDTKADVGELVKIEGKIIAKADKIEVNDLITIVNSKVDNTTLDSIKEELDQKATITTVDSLKSTKANVNDVVRVEDLVGKKADYADVNSLKLEVEQKATKEDILVVDGNIFNLSNKVDIIELDSNRAIEEVALVKTNVSKNEVDISSLKNKIAILEATPPSSALTPEEASELSNALNALGAKIDTTKKDIVDLKETRDRVGGELEKAKIERDQLLSKIALLESSNSSMKEELLENTSKLLKLNADIDYLTSEYDKNPVIINGLVNSVQGIEIKLVDFDRTIKKVKSDVDISNSTVGAVVSSINITSNLLMSLQAQVDNINSLIETNKNSLDYLSTAVDNTSKRISDLEGKISTAGGDPFETSDISKSGVIYLKPGKVISVEKWNFATTRIGVEFPATISAPTQMGLSIYLPENMSSAGVGFYYKQGASSPSIYWEADKLENLVKGRVYELKFCYQSGRLTANYIAYTKK